SPNSSMTSVSRVIGSGGVNCQWSRASPTVLPHHATWATRKSPVQGEPSPLHPVLNTPEAKENEPGAVGTPRKTQPPGPLQCSFCSVASNEVVSTVTVLVSTQPLSPTLTSCTIELVKVM